MTTSSISQKQPSLWSLSFIFITLSNALLFMVFEMMLPTLPLFVTKLGGEANQVGLITGAFMFSAILIRPFTGLLTHKFNKKYLLLIGIGISAICTGAYYLSTDIYILLIIRLIHGMGFGIASTFFATIAAENIPSDRRGEGMGYFGVGETVAISLGPLLGITILQSSNFITLFIGGMVLLFVSLIMALLLKKEPREIKKMENQNIRFKLLEKKVLFPSLLIFLVGIAASGIMSFISLYAIEQGFQYIGWFFFIIALASFMVRLVTGKVFDKFGHAYVLIPSAISGTIGLFILYGASTNFSFFLAAIFYGMGFGAIFPAIQTWCLNLVAEYEHEDAMSSFFNFFDLGIGGGSLLLGIIATVVSYQFVYLVSVFMYVTFLLMYISYIKLRRK
ncbi:MFS transporter [Priestia endophytica]|uniref:MFS transporter n=1 Tax=Priestia endophytica TaxID=135735 RepID=UPI002281806D|nr:MFS transporter [Priestia endophytica]MCY8235426.1 MFS transporter [Priestia endophytica]